MSIAAGVANTLALRSDGMLLAWGFNSYGNSTIPANASGVTSFDGGHFHSAISKTAAAACLGDIYVDHRIDGGDLGALLANWGPVSSSPASRACDIDGNGDVNGADLGNLLSNWGLCSN